MKKFLPICLAILSLVSLNAQDYHPMPVNSGKWDIARCWSFYPGGWHDRYSVLLNGADTVINEKVYKKLDLVTHHLPGTQFDSISTTYLGAMREANKKVFFISEYLALDTIERMLYDFNVQNVGDTIFSQILTHDLVQFIPHIVTAIDSVWIDDTYHRRIHLRDENSIFTESWIEGVGSNQGLIYASYWLLTDNSYDLICFYNEHGLDYVNTEPEFEFCISPLPDIACALSTSVDEDPEQDQYVVFPNPAEDFLQVRGEHWVRAEIISSLGQVINGCPYQEQLETGHLSPGIYFLRLLKNSYDPGTMIRFVKL